jgi:hypothetical protein
MKRVFHAIAVLTTLASLSCTPAFAEPYPSRLVRVMVPASAGGCGFPLRSALRVTCASHFIQENSCTS